MIETKFSFNVWYNALKAEFALKLWYPAFRIVFDLFKWDVKVVAKKNKQRAWVHGYIGPVLLGFEWDFNPNN